MDIDLPVFDLTRYDWQRAAACLSPDLDPEMFFPRRGESSRPAREVCSECPVRLRCLSQAMQEPVQGVWGGKSERERKLMRKSERLAS